MFRLYKQVFITLLSFSRLLATKCVSLNDESCLVGPIRMNLILNELHYYPFMVSSNRCNGNCDTLDDPSGRIWIPNKTGDVNLNVFDMITRINKSKTLTKHILYDCKCKFSGSKCNSYRKWVKITVDVSVKIQ